MLEIQGHGNILERPVKIKRLSVLVYYRTREQRQGFRENGKK